MTPVWPRRSLWLGEIWLASIIAGAAVAYALHVLKPIISSVRAMNELSRFPVLGVVTVAFPGLERKLFWKHLWRFSAAAACLVAAFAAALALNWLGARLSIHAIKVLVTT